jgi:hypothetical protein
MPPVHHQEHDGHRGNMRRYGCAGADAGFLGFEAEAKLDRPVRQMERCRSRFFRNWLRIFCHG